MADDGIPIFWVEPTGVQFCHEGHWCEECKVVTRVEVPLDHWERAFPEPRPCVPCKQCHKSVPMNSRGLEEEMIRPDIGERFKGIQHLPPGAVWEQRGRQGDPPYNWRQSPRPDGKTYIIHRANKQDRRVLVCKLPDGHDWVIDSRCRNCALPNDDKHWCWIREGRPEDGTLNVTKGGKKARTCQAGAGSIQTGSWHGFLRNGRLVQC